MSLSARFNRAAIISNEFEKSERGAECNFTVGAFNFFSVLTWKFLAVIEPILEWDYIVFFFFFEEKYRFFYILLHSEGYIRKFSLSKVLIVKVLRVDGLTLNFMLSNKWCSLLINVIKRLSLKYFFHFSKNGKNEIFLR